MTLKNVLALGLASVGVFFLDKLLVKKLHERITRFLCKRFKLDHLHINKFLAFGIVYPDCEDERSQRHDVYECQNFECNYGKIGYVLQLIRGTRSTLDLCIYCITADVMGQEIVRAKERGVKVRVIADSDFAMSTASKINDFKKAGIPIRQRMSPHEMHHKFLILDSELVIGGSMNFTWSGVFSNMEHLLITSNPELVEQFVNGFEALWDDFALEPGASQEYFCWEWEGYGVRSSQEYIVNPRNACIPILKYCGTPKTYSCFNSFNKLLEALCT